jgi:cob(I)alamin adenosyltransferase
MAVYTRTGDKGNTKVFDKKTGTLVKIGKSSCKIKSIGAIDELNSFLGVSKSFSVDGDFKKKIIQVQKNLFTINSILAGSSLRFSKTQTKKLEKQIDKWEGELPVLKNFLIYGGTPESSLVYYCRALCRRAERSLVSYAKKEKVSESVLIYFNRLSDYLFMLARYTNHKNKITEDKWQRG